MKSVYQGSCLCGGVRFEVEGEIEQFYLCHCQYCRKDTGSAHAANLFSSTARLSWLSGETQVRQFDLPGTRHSKSFCSNCGSALPRLHTGTSRWIVVPAGSLDSDVAAKPDAHIFVSSKANWDESLEQAPRIDKLP